MLQASVGETKIKSEPESGLTTSLKTYHKRTDDVALGSRWQLLGWESLLFNTKYPVTVLYSNESPGITASNRRPCDAYDGDVDYYQRLTEQNIESGPDRELRGPRANTT
ncbi:hypothetical protein EVAR_96315_1 [Eumeta japonica]|uniref:Uncharacterized protein n=1 Tax=Eumeta variegata TaxID=151549 RepID=A0A4C1VZ10_EUMVA|nr:hypothetical protein EVAR_96315_1 [Eumeta japonica]